MQRTGLRPEGTGRVLWLAGIIGLTAVVLDMVILGAIVSAREKVNAIQTGASLKEKFHVRVTGSLVVLVAPHPGERIASKDFGLKSPFLFWCSLCAVGTLKWHRKAQPIVNRE